MRVISCESQHRHRNIISSAGTRDAPISKRPSDTLGSRCRPGTRYARLSTRSRSRRALARCPRAAARVVASSSPSTPPTTGRCNSLGKTETNNTPPACADPLFRPHPAPQRRRRALRRRSPRARQRFVLVRVRVPQSPAVPARARRQRQPAQPNLGSAGECRRVGRPGPFPRSVGEARPGIAALKSRIPPVSSTAPNEPQTHRSHLPTTPVSHHERSPRGTTSYEYNPSGWIESAALKQSPRTPTTRRSAAFVPCPSTCCHVTPRTASRRPSWSTAT